jgi:regulator of protease activity HflC (stomatin/prohibitin superfamily)
MFGRKPPADPELVDDGEPDYEARRLPEWLSATLRISGIYLGVIFLLVVFVVIAASNRVFYRISSGQRGVRWALFGGTVLDRDYNEGLRTLPPWDRLYLYDVRIQEVHGDVIVLSSNGLPITVSYSVRYQPDLKKLPYLHQTYGPNYVETLLKPEIVGSLREVLGHYRPEEIYSRSEQGLIDEIFQALAAQMTDRYVIIQTVLVEKLRLTGELEGAINQKLVDEQNALAYEFRLNREHSEAQRKEIEAEGIKAFRDKSGIDILRWRGIDATVELAKSPNSKIIVIGPGAGQLPIILNTDKDK